VLAAFQAIRFRVSPTWRNRWHAGPHADNLKGELMFSKLSNVNAKIGAALLLAVASVGAMAQSTGTDPTTVFDATTTSVTSNVQHYGAGLVTLAGVAVAFLIGIKYVKKIRSAA
jgi:hypothetical protein